PAGYRNACRGIALAERLGLPIVTFVDTPGADVSSAAENDGIAMAIAQAHAAMAAATVPTVSVTVGEGGSGGAQAFSATDRLLIRVGTQMLTWEEGFCALLVARGFHVVRFDNRDVGASTWIDTPGLDIGAAVFAALGGDTSAAPYVVSDMAADAVGLLDALGL